MDIELVTQYPPIACGSEVGVKVHTGGEDHFVAKAELAEVESLMEMVPACSPFAIGRRVLLAVLAGTEPFRTPGAGIAPPRIPLRSG